MERHGRNGATGENTRPAARDAINDEIISTNCGATGVRALPTTVFKDRAFPLLERISNEIVEIRKKPPFFSFEKLGKNWTCILKSILRGIEDGDSKRNVIQRYAVGILIEESVKMDGFLDIG